MINETTRQPASGYLGLTVGLVLVGLAVASLVTGIRTENPLWLIPLVVAVLLAVFTFIGALCSLQRGVRCPSRRSRQS